MVVFCLKHKPIILPLLVARLCAFWSLSSRMLDVTDSVDLAFEILKWPILNDISPMTMAEAIRRIG